MASKASFKTVKGYRIPQTRSYVEDEWCTRVAASILDFRLKKEQELMQIAEEEKNRKPQLYPSTLSPHRLNCDLENLGLDMTDPQGSSFSEGKHKILRVGYNRTSTRNWRNTTRIKSPVKPEKPEKPMRGYGRRHRHRAIPKIKVDAPIDGAYAYKGGTSKGFTESKLPHRYKEIKSVMQPSLPTTGNEARFQSIPRLVQKATEIWTQEEEEERKREERWREMQHEEGEKNEKKSATSATNQGRRRLFTR